MKASCSSAKVSSFLKLINESSSAAFIVVFLLCLCPREARAQTASVPARVIERVDERNLVSLRGNVPALARPEYDRGPVPDSQPLRRLLLVLQRNREQEAALQSLLDEQQDKSSANFHAWQSPEEFGKRFGPADADIQTLTQWLMAHGFTEIRVAAGRTVIEFSGNVTSVRKAFHTEIHRYVVNGEEHMANASDPQIPASFKSLVAGVVSLHDFRKKPMYHLARGFTRTRPTSQTGPEFTYSCFDYITGNSVTCHPLGPYDFASIYNVLPLWNAASPIDGTGQSIAIVARTNINPQDVSDFRSLSALPPNSPQVVLDGTDPGLVPGDETEADLDVEWSGSVAKGATIKLVVSESTEVTDGVDLSTLYIVDNNLAPVMSESYEQCELNMGTAGNLFYKNLWQQAAAQGITVLVSSGDNGSAGCDFEVAQGLQPPQPAQYGLEVNGISSTLYNVAVGGTDFADYFNSSTYWNATNDPTTQQSAKGYIPETTWNDSCTNAIFASPSFPISSSNPETICNNPSIPEFAVALGGSGGKSNCTSPTGTTVSTCSGGYAKPAWQAAPGVPNDQKRDLPDVSLFASNGFANSFYILCEADISNNSPCSASNFTGVGGTSASSPAFAGLMALVNQKTGSRQGNANYVLYAMAAKQSSLDCNSSTGPATGCVFNDITAGTVAMPCVTGSLNCTTSNAGDQFGILSGYQAGTGYDLATGLGSVNANNLINNWGSVARTPSTTTLILNGGNPVNITHGTPVSVTVSVSPTSPLPTGNASLIAMQGSNTFGIDLLTVSNGTASGTTNMLPGGTSYSVYSHYAGDANYGASDSNSLTVTVSPEASETDLHVVTLDWATGQPTNPNATSVPYGTISLVRADIMNGSGTVCVNAANGSLQYACPTGTVSFAFDGTPLGTGPVVLNSEGYAAYKNGQLTAGAHSFAADYSGDESYKGGTATASMTVIPSPTATSPEIPHSMPIGTPAYFQVMMTTKDAGSYAVPPSGTFTIFDGNTQVPATVTTLTGVIYPQGNSPYVWETLEGNVLATFSGTPGPRVLTVNYTGDTNYASSVSNATTFEAVYPTQTALTSSAATVVSGQPVTITAHIVPAQSASSGPTGTVVFTYGYTNQTIAVSNSQAQVTIPSLPGGNILISATYSGDSNYGSSTGTLTQVVTPVSTTTSASLPSSTIAQGISVPITALITPAQMGAAPLTGSVQFTANGSNIGGATAVNNQAQISAIFSTLGPVQIQAAYSGDPNYSASTGTVTETVVSQPPDFSLVGSGTTTLTVSAGQTATFSNTISVTSLNGFSSPVILTCSLPATATTCFVNPNTITGGNGTATVSVNTTRRGLAAPFFGSRRFHFRPHQVPHVLVSLLLVVLLLGSSHTRYRRLASALSFASLCLILVFQATGCGSGSGSSSSPPATGTPAGTYTVTVIGTSGNTTHATTLTLIVS